MKAGNLIFSDAGVVYLTNTFNTASTSSDPESMGRIIYKGNTTIMGRVGSLGQMTFQNTILEVHDGALATNRVGLGVGAAWASAAIYQRGGTFATTSDSDIGPYGYGYYELLNGVGYGAYIRIGGSTGATGVFAVRGGSYTNTSGNGFAVARSGGRGEVYLSGGTAWINTIRLCMGQWASAGGNGSHAVFTVDGALCETPNRFQLADSNRTNVTIIVNFNQGVLAAPDIRNGGNIDPVNVNSYVGFNGGTYRATHTGKNVFPADYGPTKIIVYEKGAVIDTNGKDISFGKPLVKPEGKMIDSIELPKGYTNKQYLGARSVHIDGVGIGASAITDFDSVNQKISKIIVTGPGSGYDDTTTAWVCGVNYTSKSNKCTVVMKDAIGGGLTKIGSGTLTLNAVNTWSGTTIVSNGTLKIGVADALPVSPLFVAEDGMLNLNKKGAISVPSLQLTGEIINGDVTVTEQLVVDASDFGKVGHLTGNLTFSENATLSILNGDEIEDVGVTTILTTDGTIQGEPKFNGSWRVVNADGKSLKLMKRGMVIIVR